MKKKLNYNSRIKKEILKGVKRFFYFIQANFFRYKYFTSRNYVKLSQKKISLLCPTKNRSKKFKRMAESLIMNTNKPINIELLVCFDVIEEEDKYYDEILKLLSIKGFSTKKFYMNFKTHAERNNYLAKNSLGDFIFPINDDLIFITKNWDITLNEEFSRILTDEPFCLWINCDRKYKYLDYSAFPVINRYWYNCLGYVVPEYFIFWYLDWWICEVSRLSKKYFLSKVKIHQFHAETYRSEIDQTYKNNATSEKLQKDYLNWLNTKEYRLQDSIKLSKKTNY